MPISRDVLGNSARDIKLTDGPQYKESRIWFSCDPVNQWVMRKDIPGEASTRYGKRTLWIAR